MLLKLDNTICNLPTHVMAIEQKYFRHFQAVYEHTEALLCLMLVRDHARIPVGEYRRLLSTFKSWSCWLHWPGLAILGKCNCHSPPVVGVEFRDPTSHRYIPKTVTLSRSNQSALLLASFNISFLCHCSSKCFDEPGVTFTCAEIWLQEELPAQENNRFCDLREKMMPRIWSIEHIY